MLHYSRTIKTVPIFITMKQHCTVANYTTIKDFPLTERLLNETTKAECIERLRNIRVPQQKLDESNKKRAAVLIPLCLVKNELSLLYTLRTAGLKRHRGQVSFPGGMEDTTDTSLENTALRETEEELGIPRDKINLWGSGSIYVGKEFSVLPVVGYLGDINIKQLNPNKDEVDVVFTLSLKHLCDKQNCRTTQFRYKGHSYVLPVYINGEYRIWGITALITHILLVSLLKNHYKHRLHLIKPIVPSQKSVK